MAVRLSIDSRKYAGAVNESREKWRSALLATSRLKKSEVQEAVSKYSGYFDVTICKGPRDLLERVAKDGHLSEDPAPLFERPESLKAFNISPVIVRTIQSCLSPIADAINESQVGLADSLTSYAVGVKEVNKKLLDPEYHAPSGWGLRQIHSDLVRRIGDVVRHGVMPFQDLAHYDAFANAGIRLGNMNKEFLFIRDIAALSPFVYHKLNQVFVMDRPEVYSFDERGRLHPASGKGPSLSWKDGTSLYYWHGVKVSKQLLDGTGLTVDTIRKEQNQEIRRVMLDIYGVERFVKDSGATKVHEDKYGALYKFSFGESWNRVEIGMIHVKNSTVEPDGTIREFWIEVPSEMQTAHEAVAWTFEEAVDTYEPEKEA